MVAKGSNHTNPESGIFYRMTDPLSSAIHNKGHGARWEATEGTSAWSHGEVLDKTSALDKTAKTITSLTKYGPSILIRWYFQVIVSFVKWDNVVLA